MIAAVVITVLVLLVVSVAAAGGRRRLVLDESSHEHRRQDPTVHTVTYAVPNGIDPVDLKGAIARGGFRAISMIGARHCLLVECPAADRDRLRQVIESAPETAYDGTEPDLHPVVFEDERKRAA